MLEKVCKISVVVHGKTEVFPDIDKKDPYLLPKTMGIYVEIDSPFKHISTDLIIDRIVKNRQLYEARNKRKQEKALIEERLLQEERDMVKNTQ